MFRKKFALIISLTSIILLCTGISLYCSFKPIPIINNPDDCAIVKFAYNQNYKKGEAEFIILSDYNEQEVLNCLSNYKKKKTLNVCRATSLNSCQFQLYIHTENGLNTIELGDNNWSDLEYGTFMYTVTDAENLKNNLFKIIERKETHEKLD